MFNKFISVISLFILVSLSGCDQFQSPSNTAILDLDAIANATGHAERIKQQIEQANNELKSQLTTISNKLNEQLTSEKEKMGKKPSKDEKRNMDQLTLLANQKMQQAKVLASQKSQQYKAALIQQLRLSVKPIAESIAKKRGADIVIAANNSTIWFDPTVDITDEIIAEMRAQPSTTVIKQEKPPEPANKQTDEKDEETK